MRVVVVGAGIGGLTLALSLHAVGIEVEVYEAAPEIRPLGVGINLLPHASRELIELGLSDDLARIGVATEALIYANRFGQQIWREARGRFAGYNWPQYSLHRGSLQMLLRDKVVERMGAGVLHTGQRAIKVETIGDGARLTLTNNSVAGDLVVACDGIHSGLRKQFYSNEGEPLWNRRILWRGVTRGAPFLGGATMVMAGHQDQKFVCYPIDPKAAPGSSLINWIAELRFADGELTRREDWNRQGRQNDFLPAFADWRFDWLDVPETICKAEEILEYPMVDRDPLMRWTFGRVTLLGDAAHPMYPIGSNGASQAILDARALGFYLATAQDIDAALNQYEEARRPSTSQIVLLNRRNGPEQVMQLAYERAPDGFADVLDVISAAELDATAGEYKRVAGFDRDALNNRVSMTPPARKA